MVVTGTHARLLDVSGTTLLHVKLANHTHKTSCWREAGRVVWGVERSLKVLENRIPSGVRVIIRRR